MSFDMSPTVPLGAADPAAWMRQHHAAHFRWYAELMGGDEPPGITRQALGDVLDGPNPGPSDGSGDPIDATPGALRRRFEAEIAEGWARQAAMTGPVGAYVGALAGFVAFAAFAADAHWLVRPDAVTWLVGDDGWPLAVAIGVDEQRSGVGPTGTAPVAAPLVATRLGATSLDATSLGATHLTGTPPIDTPLTVLVGPSHRWVGKPGVEVEPDPQRRAARCVEALLTVASPIVEQARAIARVGRAGLWNTVADAMGHAVMYQDAFPGDPRHVAIIEALVGVPGAPWSARPDIRTVTTDVGDVCIAQRGGCCLVYTWVDRQHDEEEADDHDDDEMHARFHAAFPDPRGAPAYCADCSLRDQDDCFARLTWWRTEEIKQRQAGAAR